MAIQVSRASPPSLSSPSPAPLLRRLPHCAPPPPPPLPSPLTLAGRRVHQTEPSDEYEEGIVCEEMQTGYSCGEKLVRAAYVKVSAGP